MTDAILTSDFGEYDFGDEAEMNQLPILPELDFDQSLDLPEDDSAFNEAYEHYLDGDFADDKAGDDDDWDGNDGYWDDSDGPYPRTCGNCGKEIKSENARCQNLTCRIRWQLLCYEWKLRYFWRDVLYKLGLKREPDDEIPF